MTSRSERRRSGVWQPEAVEANSQRQQWREPNSYNEWLAQEIRLEKATLQHLPRRQPSMPMRGSESPGTMSGSATIRAVTPENQHAGFGIAHSNASLPHGADINLERGFASRPQTIVGSSTPRAHDSPSGSVSRSRTRANERNWSRDAVGRASQGSSPPRSRNGNAGVGNSSLLRQRGGKSNGQRQPIGMPDNHASSRPRTRTLEDRSRRDQSPTALPSRSRNRVGSMHTPSSPPYHGGADFLASLPGTTEAVNGPSAFPLNSHVQGAPETSGPRSISPVSSSTVDSTTSALPSANARRILHLMKTLNGRMSGNVVFRRGFGKPWSQSYCYIHEESGSLVYESRASEGAHRILVPDLRGTVIQSSLDGDVPYLEVVFPHTSEEVHIKLHTQSDFDAWFAALLHWQPRDGRPASSDEDLPEVQADSALADASQRRASIVNPGSRHGRDRAASDRSNGSDRRQSVVTSTPKENPVIKIGKMIYWDTNVRYSNGSVGQPSTRPATYRMQSSGARRWRRISGQLRENGELKLHADVDNSLLSVVQLSQLSRCAIQRLDPSVLEAEFCIAIYPQYTSSYTDTQPDPVRLIFLSLESRVLYEVWFVLLRAFTMPSIYGPRLHAEAESTDAPVARDLESMIATSTTYTFRMERSLSVRVVEAKMQNTTGSGPNDSGFSGGYSRQQANTALDKHGYYAEVLLDNETRGKTAVKYEGANPLWGESFEFQDLPPVLNSASVIVKRRPHDQPVTTQQDNKQIHDAFGQQQGGITNLAFDVTCGQVEIQMEELEPEKEVEKWWPVVNLHGQHVGEVLVKIRADEGIILMARDYEQLGDVLQRFSNGLTLQIAQMIPSQLKRLSDSLLNIFQVAGKASDWLMALVEEEIDGIHKETPITRLRYSRRLGSNDTGDPLGSGAPNSDRELIVRDLNRSATLEANLLFRGNTLLTKSLDTHMRRVGKEYLEESLTTMLQEINDKDLDCEVDPNRVGSPQDVDRNWRKLLLCTQEVWKGIVGNKARCPIELRVIFRHIRACAEDRYGDFLRSVSYSSVSGFLFLRFFCPAVLNPKLFGLLKEDIKPRARRTFTLIAKSLQTMANMASFGTKEPWMEPMNVFLVQHRESFKTFIDDVCYVPAPLTTATFSSLSPTSPTYPPGFVSAGQNLSYTTPMTIMQRLPPSSREGFPSLPYLIDQARSYAELIHLWLDATHALSDTNDSAALPGRTRADVLVAIEASGGDLKAFHQQCEELNTRTQECLNRAERAERPDTPHSFQWEDVINQLQKSGVKNTLASQDLFDAVADKIASDPTILPEEVNPAIEATMAQLRGHSTESDDDHRLYAQIPPYSEPGTALSTSKWHRPGSSSLSTSFHSSSPRGPYPPHADALAASASANISNASSAVNSDTEHQTTALPSYDREVRHRERREAARLQIQKQMEAARVKEKDKEKDKEKKRVNKLVPVLRKKHGKQEKEVSGAPPANGGGNGMI